jgi:HEPN superfamily AbiU2-like protein
MNLTCRGEPCFALAHQRRLAHEDCEAPRGYGAFPCLPTLDESVEPLVSALTSSPGKVLEVSKPGFVPITVEVWDAHAPLSTAVKRRRKNDGQVGLKLSYSMRAPFPDDQFEQELEIFRRESEGATQFFYAYLAVHATAADHESVHNLLNQAPLFWNTALAGLQTASLIALGRIFDQNSAHNIDRLLRIAQRNPEIFSKSALGARRQGRNEQEPVWLPEFLSDAYEPRPSDFRRIRAYVSKRRRIYESRYADLRNRVFAHRELADDGETAPSFAQTNIREQQRLVTFLGSPYEALWHLFNNGRKPALRPQRYSTKRMRDLPSPSPDAVQEKITHEVESFLRAASTAQRLPK